MLSQRHRAQCHKVAFPESYLSPTDSFRSVSQTSQLSSFVHLQSGPCPTLSIFLLHPSPPTRPADDHPLQVFGNAAIGLASINLSLRTSVLGLIRAYSRPLTPRLVISQYRSMVAGVVHRRAPRVRHPRTLVAPPSRYVPPRTLITPHDSRS